MYGTTKVLIALRTLDRKQFPQIKIIIDKATNWLLKQQNADGGWSVCKGNATSFEETGLALEAIASLKQNKITFRSMEKALEWYSKTLDNDPQMTPSPIGFYFAKLWYFEALYPIVFSLAGLNKMKNTLEKE